MKNKHSRLSNGARSNQRRAESPAQRGSGRVTLRISRDQRGDHDTNRGRRVVTDCYLGLAGAGSLLLKKGTFGEHQREKSHGLMNASCVPVWGGQGGIQPTRGAAQAAHCIYPSLQFLPSPWRCIELTLLSPQDKINFIMQNCHWFQRPAWPE